MRPARSSWRNATAMPSSCRPFAERYGEDAKAGLTVHSRNLRWPSRGPIGLLGDLHDLYLMACERDIRGRVGEAAQGARDREPASRWSSDMRRRDDAPDHVGLGNRMREAAPKRGWWR